MGSWSGEGGHRVGTNHHPSAIVTGSWKKARRLGDLERYRQAIEERRRGSGGRGVLVEEGRCRHSRDRTVSVIRLPQAGGPPMAARACDCARQYSQWEALPGRSARAYLSRAACCAVPPYRASGRYRTYRTYRTDSRSSGRRCRAEVALDLHLLRQIARLLLLLLCCVRLQRETAGLGLPGRPPPRLHRQGLVSPGGPADVDGPSAPRPAGRLSVRWLYQTSGRIVATEDCSR
ncbi:hypothetical protein VTN02DRAFT_3354 [Thermoascus thermophilus]